VSLSTTARSAALLLRLLAHQPRPLPARRQRGVGPRASRPRHHDYVMQEQAEAVVATGSGHFNHLADIAFLTVYFPHNVVAHINVNWLSPVKVRTTLIGGRDKMLVWNDLDADEKIKVYDKA